MRGFVAIDRAIGRGDRGQGEGVGGGSRGHRKDPRLAPEQLGEAAVERDAEIVLAVGGRGAAIGRGQGCHDLGATEATLSLRKSSGSAFVAWLMLP